MGARLPVFVLELTCAVERRAFPRVGLRAGRRGGRMKTRSSMHVPTDTEIKVLTRRFLKARERLSRSDL